MTLEELYHELKFVDATRTSRTTYAKMVLDDLTLFPKLMTILFMYEDKISCYAAWVFEYVCAEYIFAIIPYLDEFTSNINKVHLDSAVRPVAKVCGFLAKSNYSKEHNTLKKMLLPKHKERIVEACFDWMINKEKVAVKAYAMNTLCLFGKDYKWIHTNLALILEQDYQSQSAAYKARAKHILKKIKANKI